MAQLEGAKKLRQMLADPTKTIVCPGVHDGLSARIALSVGFDALYMTGAGTAASRLGQPDLGLTTADDMASHAGMIAGLDRSVPVIADADTGFGGPLSVARTVERYILAGVAACHLEDQVTTKRCGHLGGKELVDAGTFAARVRAAAAARDRLRCPDFVIIARTDALAGRGYEEAASRLRAALAAGADAVFLEGVRDRAHMASLPRDLAPAPAMLNMVEGGVTPLVGADEAAALGYRLVIWPMAAPTAMYRAVRDACRELRDTGRIRERFADGDGEEQADPDNEGRTRRVDGGVRDVFEICGLSSCAAFDESCGGSSFTGERGA